MGARPVGPRERGQVCQDQTRHQDQTREGVEESGERDAGLVAELRARQDDPPELLRLLAERVGARQVVLLSSFQAEESVLIDMMARVAPGIRTVTIDTGRLPDETYATMERLRARYGIHVEVICPEARHVEAMVTRYGVNLFYQEVGLRQLCCYVRKVLPLQRALQGAKAWITGLRREQSATRAGVSVVDYDPLRPGVLKLAPLAFWTSQQVWDYIRRYQVPYHPFYDRGYTSIGCAPCTRPVEPGADPRSGRWWWEWENPKECGLHRSVGDPLLERRLEALLQGDPSLQGR